MGCSSPYKLDVSGVEVAVINASLLVLHTVVVDLLAFSSFSQEKDAAAPPATECSALCIATLVFRWRGGT